MNNTVTITYEQAMCYLERLEDLYDEVIKLNKRLDLITSYLENGEQGDKL